MYIRDRDLQRAALWLWKAVADLSDARRLGHRFGPGIPVTSYQRHLDLKLAHKDVSSFHNHTPPRDTSHTRGKRCSSELRAATRLRSPSTMSSRLVLITGVNGFVGTHTALYFLERGWRVRGAVRTEAKRAALQNNRSLKPFFDRQACECVVFPRHDDLSGWKKAVQGVNGVCVPANIRGPN